MNKEIQILHTIFQLELNPPFELMESEYVYEFSNMYDKFSKKVGDYYKFDHKVILFSAGIQKKIKQVFNADTLSNEDIYHIAKHLFNWLQNNFPENVEIVAIWNNDTRQVIRYPSND